jgi:DNA-binding transcriptional ArsR family regulator
MLKLVEALGSGVRREILSILIEGERSLAEIAELLGISKQLARYHLQVLEEHRLVESERRGKSRVFKLPSFVTRSDAPGNSCQ